jgi:hypothetical protein
VFPVGPNSNPFTVPAGVTQVMIEGWGAGAGGACSRHRLGDIFHLRRCRDSVSPGQLGGSSAVTSNIQGRLITIPGGGVTPEGGNILYVSGGNSGNAGSSGGVAGSCGSAGFVPGGGGGSSCWGGDHDEDDCLPKAGAGALYARGTFSVSPGERLTIAIGSGGAGAVCSWRDGGGHGADGRVMIWY